MLPLVSITGRKEAIVIGAGLGGLAAALRLQALGWVVTIYETHARPGGYARTIRENGYTFHSGSAMVSEPGLIAELFHLHGKKLEDYLEWKPLEEFYRYQFHDGSTLSYGNDEAALIRQIEAIEPADVAGYHAFRKAATSFHEVSKEASLLPPTASLKSAFHRILPGSGQTLYKLACKHFSNPKLQQAFSFFPVWLGGNPYKSPASFSSHLHRDLTHGRHHFKGGMTALIDALVKLFEENGGKLELNRRVAEIMVDHGKVVGARLAKGPKHSADIVVSNGNVCNTYRKLILPKWRKKWSDKKLATFEPSCGLFTLLLGTDVSYTGIAHHTVLLNDHFETSFREIFETHSVPVDPLLFLYAPSQSDPSLAPFECEALQVTVPVPNLLGKTDWAKVNEFFVEEILQTLESICPDLRNHIAVKKIRTPFDDEQDHDAWEGGAWQFAPHGQTGLPHNRSEDIEGLYFVGAGTHPGAGISEIISGAKLLDNFLIS